MDSMTPTVTVVDGKRVINWPDPKPDAFLISSALFAELIDQLNEAYPLGTGILR